MKNLKVPSRQKHLAKLESEGVEITFDPQEEELNIFEQFDNEEAAQQVADKYNAGNGAAWFCAHVIVKYRRFEEDDYLGGCSYGSFKEFTNAEKGYYIDMVRQCIEKINKEIDSTNEDIQKRWNIRKAKQLVEPYGYAIFPDSISEMVASYRK